MPHFVIDCSQSALAYHQEEYIIEQIHLVANATGFFVESDITIRVNPHRRYSVANKYEDFVHIFAYIIQGRTAKQKANLSKQVVSKLAEMFPHIPNIAMNISGFERATYFNRTMIEH